MIKYVKVRYTDPEFPTIQINPNGNWIDLKAAEDVTLKAGEFTLISLGVAMAIPEGYEAYLAPRSSTFKNFGILQTNSIGIIDTSYSGNNDIWKMPVYATRDTEIHKGDRIAQFRFMETMSIRKDEGYPPYMQSYFEFEPVDNLENEDRGGFGSTGIN